MGKILGMAIVGILLWVNGSLCGELRIWTVDEPPASFLDKDNKISGFAVDIVRAIEERLGRADTIEIVPEARVYQVGLKEPNIVLFSFSRTPERENSFHWISLIIRKPWVLYALNNSGLEIKNIDDAKKINLIGVVRGDVRAIWLKGQGFTNLEEVTQHEQNVLKLQAGRVQLIFFDPQGLAFECKKLGIDSSFFMPVYTAKVSDVYIAMSKPGTPLETVEAWREAARQLREEGVFQEIGERWLHNLGNEGCSGCKVKDGILSF